MAALAPLSLLRDIAGLSCQFFFVFFCPDATYIAFYTTDIVIFHFFLPLPCES